MSGRFDGRKEYLPEECNLGGHKKISLAEAKRNVRFLNSKPHNNSLVSKGIYRN